MSKPDTDADLQRIARTLKAEQVAQRRWRVLHRGRPGAGYRLLYSGQDERRAREVFQGARTAMRQGELALIGPDGHGVAYASEPMVRTRW